MGAPPALRTSAVSSATSAASSASATSAASSPRAALPGASRPRRRARPRVPPALLARVAMGLSLVHAVAHARMTDCPGCCHGFPGALSERCRAVAGAARRCLRPRARGSARGAGARPAAHGQQRGADRPQSHRHVVHGTHLHQGACRGRRGTVVHRRRSAGARRRRHGGADAGRTELRGAPLRARRAGGVDRAVGDGIRRAAVRAGGSRAPPDPGALRIRSADRAARRGFLVPAHGRSVRRRGGVGDVRLLQRGRAAARDTRDHAVHHLDQRGAQPAVHLRAGVGNCRLGLGHQRRTAPRARPGGGAVPAQPLPPALPLAPHLASARGTPAAAAAPRRADGVVPGGRPAGICHLPDDADASRHGRRRRHADGRDADLACLHAGLRHRFCRHDAGRAVDRGRRARMGATRRQSGDPARGALHGGDRGADRARHAAAVAGGRLPVLRRAESRQQPVPARRRRCARARAAGAVAGIPAAGAARPCAHLSARPGVGELPAAVRPGRHRWMGGGTHLCHRAGQRTVPALALARLAGDPHLIGRLKARRMFITLKTLLHTLLLPPAGLLLLAAVGAALIAGGVRPAARRTGWALLGAGLAALWLLATPLVADGLTRIAQRCPPLDLDRPLQAQAIVILGGGAPTERAPEYGGDPAPRAELLERVTYGAYLAHRSALPVLVSGAALETLAMRASLERDFGVTTRWVENRSRDTFQNAQFSAQLLRAAGVTRILLVTDADHEWRALQEFAAAGLTVLTAPVGLYGRHRHGLAYYVPNPQALQDSTHALYELLGDLVRRALAALDLRRQTP